MAQLNMIEKKMSNIKLKLSDLNPHLMCVLCGGYYIDATTIVECLHSFCRSCIVKHLESSKYCPICEVQVHKTKPLINIRPDKTLQDIVYKLVPGLFTNEMRNRRKFYKERPHYIKPNDSESSGEVSGERKIYVNDENITFSLVYHVGPGPTTTEHAYEEFPSPVQNERRYFKCPTGVTVNHLKKLLKAKYDLNDNSYKLEVYFRDQELHDDFTLLDVAYIYLWKAKGALDLTYKIFKNVVKRQKIEETAKNGALTEGPAKQPKDCSAESPLLLQEKEFAEKTKAEEPRRTEVPASKEKPEKLKVSATPKENGVTGSEVQEVQLQISESGVMSVSRVDDGATVRTLEEPASKVPNNEAITGYASDRKAGENREADGLKRPEEASKFPTEKKSVAKPTKPTKPYKTIRCSPKTWHPVIPKEKLRPTLIKSSDEPKKQLKFFKMRNMPRFLGNPSSGVKPMYAEASENDSEDKKTEQKKLDPSRGLNKILKIDPKTLRPIEKEEMKLSQTPSASNLLTNPFIPNNNHFLFSDHRLLPPSPGTFPGKHEAKEKPPPAAACKAHGPNGTYPALCFPAPDPPPGFYPFVNLAKPQTFPFPAADKMDPLLRASRLSPFGNLSGFNVAGFHASLPPSISRLLNPHHHFRKINQSLEKRPREESTKEKSKSCDDGPKAIRPGPEKREESRTREAAAVPEDWKGSPRESGNDRGSQEITEKVAEAASAKEEDKEIATERRDDVNSGSSDGASKPETTAEPVRDCVTVKEKEQDKDKDKDR